MKISYRDLKKDMLSERGQVLLSEFVSIWHTNTGELIDVDSEDVVMRVLRDANGSRDRRLRAIYLHLRAEFTNKIESSVIPCDAMLAHKLMSQIARGRTCRSDSSQFVV